MENRFYTHRALHVNLPESKPINISFSDVSLTVNVGTFNKEKKVVLKNLCGNFKSGELTAIMGPSGAGKSSLLNILSGFQVAGMTGSLKCGYVEKAKRISCYIMQDDRLNPLFTVLETMKQASDLKLGFAMSRKAKDLIIDGILETLGLFSVRFTRCGNLSGGQKKRVSIALELIDNPPVMYLDEPTTGLDSSSCNQLVTMLQRLAREGRNIICTIHQPNATVFEMFDHIYLISDGRCLYQGTPINVVPFLQSIGLLCPQYHNPADFLLDVVTGEFGEFAEHLIRAAKDPSWRISPLSAIKGPEKTNFKPNIRQACVLIENPSEWTRAPILIKRCILQLHRDWTSTYLKLGLHIFISVVLGLIFRRAGTDADKVISNLGYLMCSVVYMSFTSLLPAILKLPSQLSVLKKEYFNNWYKFRTFYIAFLIVNIPVQISFCLVYCFISYYLSCQILEWLRFLRFLLVTSLVVTCSECLGLSFGALRSPVNGVFIGSVVLAVHLSFGGYLVLRPHMSPGVYFISHGSFMLYAFEGLVVAVYGYGRAVLDCPVTELYCHFRFPRKFLQEIGMSDGNYWTDATALVGFVIIFTLVSFYLLNKRIKSQA